MNTTPTQPLASASLNARERKAQRLLAHYATCERLARYIQEPFTPKVGSRLPDGAQFTGWLPQDAATTGYRVSDYFSSDGKYLGADHLGVKPQFVQTQFDGKKISVALFKAERLADKSSVAYCNGEISTEQHALDHHDASTMVRQALGTLPPGFFINSDPRGYGLQVDCDNAEGRAMIDACGIHRNMGGNGVLSPLIDGSR